MSECKVKEESKVCLAQRLEKNTSKAKKKKSIQLCNTQYSRVGEIVLKIK